MGRGNSFIRSVQSLLKDFEKLSARHNRYMVYDDAFKSVSLYTEYLTNLTELHKTYSKPIDWLYNVKQPAPKEPLKLNKHEQKAEEFVQLVKSNFFIKLLPFRKFFEDYGIKRKINARIKDIESNNKTMKDFQVKLENWQVVHDLSKSILNGNVDAIHKAYTEFKPLEKIKGLGTRCNLSFSAESIEIDLFVFEIDIIPSKIVTLTNTGRKSIKEMTISKRNELYHEYISSAILRVLIEIRNFYPFKKYYVNAILHTNSKITGQLGEQIVLSLSADIQTIDKINFSQVHSSSAITNFIVTQNFSRLKGFSPISKPYSPFE